MIPDLDRVYEPEQLDQLAKDLVRARGSKLDTFEKASLRRWKATGHSARIRRLPDRRLTCWPTDVPTSRGVSIINGRRVAPRDAMGYLRGEQDYKVSIGIRFENKADLDLLRAAALIEKDEDNREMLREAAAALERDSYLLVRVMSAEELKEIVGRLAQAGVTHVTLDTLRVGETKPARV